MNTQPFHDLESEVRGYCRSFPVVFETSHGSTLVDESGREYIDFFAGAGALNYGHNPESLRQPLIDYLTRGHITHSLDMMTTAKRDFLTTFDEVVLQPRRMSGYRMLFPGPTGTNAVEAALKMARKATGRTRVISFTNGYHGMTLGSLAITGNRGKRAGAGVPLHDADIMPFDGYHGPAADTVEMIERLLEDSSSGIELPAAFVLETVQAEGGVHVAGVEWLQRLNELARKHGIVFIADDIQVGVGRTGPFFSFERAGLQPDMICLSKSLSAYGLPMAMVLVRDRFDVFSPGEHNGTFRGHMPAFVTATAALRQFWTDDALSRKVASDAEIVHTTLSRLARWAGGEVRGLGLIQGLDLGTGERAGRVTQAAFERGLVIETAGPRGEVVKVLPPLVIERDALEHGLDILTAAAEASLDLTPASVPLVAGGVEASA